MQSAKGSLILVLSILTFLVSYGYSAAKESSATAFERVADYEAQARQNLFSYDGELGFGDHLQKTVFIAIFIRNKEHSLPFFFKAIEDLVYDKSRMKIWIVCDHTQDNSAAQTENWVKAVEKQYAKVDFEYVKGPWHYPKQKTDLSWTKERVLRLLELRQTALIKARESWADYILYIDADNILMNPYSLQHLMDADKVVVAPMLQSISLYSNFWGGMAENGYYKRTDEYIKIKNQEINGTFAVPMVHSIYLIDLRKPKSREIRFLPVREEYKYEFDDIIVFATHCKLTGILMYIDNSVLYGYLPVPLNDDKTLADEVESFIHLRMEVMTEPPVGIGIEMKKSVFVPEKKEQLSMLGFDKIYMINLKRRTDRRIRMKKCLRMQGIDYTVFEAIDSKNLNTTYLRKMGIDMLPGYVDPFRERGLTRGEIGCFLSHFTIWNEVWEKGYGTVMVLEDDVRFQPGFVRQITELMERIKIAEMPWDLIYVGRKRLHQVTEPPVENVEGLVEADYSYWTIGYLLSHSGAEKLIDGDPLGRMVPVDEYLPIMYDKHPSSMYKDQFPTRNLIALSADPLLIYPTHYTNEINYFSDTETSSIWEEVADKTGKHESSGPDKDSRPEDGTDVQSEESPNRKDEL
ncbi:procollagen galactosyltransferase 2-like [Styela clava]